MKSRQNKKKAKYTNKIKLVIQTGIKIFDDLLFWIINTKLSV